MNRLDFIELDQVIGSGPVTKQDGYGNSCSELTGNQVGSGIYSGNRVRI